MLCMQGTPLLYELVISPTCRFRFNKGRYLNVDVATSQEPFRTWKSN